MTTTASQQERTIRATIDESAISRVSSFFNAHLDDILNEALQNSRRSKATVVKITTDGAKVRIEDDGAGIDDPQTILSFGRTDWTDDSTQDEHPAGMGMYAMARLDPVSITSKTADQPAWTVSLMPKHFTGTDDAVVKEADDTLFAAGHGTIVDFDWQHPVEHDLRTATQYYPVPVLHNGKPVPQQDFLNGAEYITNWHGLRIGIFKSQGFGHLANTGQVNFHGVTTYGDQIPHMIYTMLPHHMYGAKVDVVNCPQLELTLPARKRLVKTPFVQEMKEAITHAIYTTIAQHPEQPGVPYEHQQAAAKMGIKIPDPKASLPTWYPTDRSDDNHCIYTTWIPTDDQCFIVSKDLDIPHQHTLALAMSKTPDAPNLFHPQDEGLSGYGWYDALPKITDLKVDLQYDDLVIEMTEDVSQLPHQRPDAITVKAQVSEADGTKRELELASPAAFPNHEDTFIDDLCPLIRKDCDFTSHQMTDLLMPAYFKFSDEYDSDSYETQQENAQENILRNMETLLISRERAVENSVHKALYNSGIHSMPAGTKLTITVQEEGYLFTQLEVPETTDEDDG